VSAGDSDWIRPLVEELGQVCFWKLFLKPGRPFAWGQVAGVPFFGLPGNPVAAAITALQLLWPALQRLEGADVQVLPRLKLRLEAPLRRGSGRPELARAQLAVAPRASVHSRGRICCWRFRRSSDRSRRAPNCGRSCCGCRCSDSERCVAAEPFAAAIGAPLALPKRGVVFEGLQEFLAAALRRAAAVSADGYEHNRFTGEHPTNAVLHQAAVHSVAAAAITGELLQLLLGHSGVVLELQGFKLAAIGSDTAHPADKDSLSRTVRDAAVLLLFLPTRQRNERLEAGAVEIDPELHGISLR
jgi:hypothetical protein